MAPGRLGDVAAVKERGMRDTTTALVGHYLDHLDLSGDVLEIYAEAPGRATAALFGAPRFRHRGVDTADIDLTDCGDVLADASFDVVVSSDVFEHLERPWRAAEEIGRVLRPGGLAITHTLFAGRNQPRPIDYWRFSAECLEFLFADLDCLEQGYDLSERRLDQPGHWPSGRDSVPVDQLGGWREHWSVYCVARKGTGPAVPRFKDSDHPLAGYLRMDTQGTVTNPELRGVTPSGADPLRAIRPELGDLGERLTGLEQLIVERTAQLDEIALRSKRLERRLERLSASLPVRAARTVRNGLHTLLK